jgi:hypothetical protein
MSECDVNKITKRPPEGGLYVALIEAAGAGQLVAAFPTFSKSTHSFVDLLAIASIFRRKLHDSIVDISIEH